MAFADPRHRHPAGRQLGPAGAAVPAAAPCGTRTFRRRVPRLDRHIPGFGRGEAVRPFGGVSRAGADRVSQSVADRSGDARLGLVADDASHFFGETKAAFDVPFPRLAPGGLFLVEEPQWSFHASFCGIDRFRGRMALADLVLLCAAVRGARAEIIDRAVMLPTCTITCRGPAGLPAEGCDLAAVAVSPGKPLECLR